MIIDIQHYPKFLPLLILIIGLSILKYFALLVYKKRNNIKRSDNFIVGINSIYYVILSILLVLFIMSILGVSLREFFTSISIIAAAIAIVTKDYIAQVVNGMILMFNNQFSIGDNIRIGQHKGKIINISLLNVQILSHENELIYIPNTNMLGMDVVNYSKSDNIISYFDITGDIKLIQQYEEIEKFYREKLENIPELIVSDSLHIKILEVRKNIMTLRFEVKLVKYSIKNERLFKKEIISDWLKFSPTIPNLEK